MGQRVAEFNDPRLVAIFDSVNAYDSGTQPDFYRQLASELGASTVIDLGCGTGVITCEMARAGFEMVGVEPSEAMLEIARRRPGANAVEWMCGGPGDLGHRVADMAFMSGHVAQFFITDDEWNSALAALAGALRPDGWLSFESRDPNGRDWERWTRDRSRWVDDPVAGRVETWSELVDVEAGVASYAIHYEFERSGSHLVSSAQLRFRTLRELTDSLAAAGFVVERVSGDWDRRPVGPDTRELIVVARRRSTEKVLDECAGIGRGSNLE